jgi:acetyl-CoA carboxylase biotin carboxylase subunit
VEPTKIGTRDCREHAVQTWDRQVSLAKLLVHQPTHAEALAVMRRALGEFVIEGVKTTIPLHRQIMNHSAFIEGHVDTTFIERTWQQKKNPV